MSCLQLDIDFLKCKNNYLKNIIANRFILWINLCNFRKNLDKR